MAVNFIFKKASRVPDHILAGTRVPVL